MILDLYNRWTLQKTLVNDSHRMAETEASKKRISFWQTSEYNIYHTRLEKRDKLETELYYLLEGKIFQLPQGNFLVPGYNDCMDYTVFIMEQW